MSVGYRALLRLEPSASAIAIAEEQLHVWLESKLPKSQANDFSRSTWADEGRHRISRDLEVTVTKHTDESTGDRLELIRLREVNKVGVFIVSLTAIERPGNADRRQSLVIDVEKAGTSDDEAIDAVRPPRLVAQLLRRSAVRDGSTRLYAKPKIVEIQDVPEVYRAILDPERTASVVVAPSLGADVTEGWTQVLSSLTKDSVGVSTSFIVLPEALDRLGEILPDSHTVERGNIRTFAPGVDLDSPADGLRHRFLGASALARSLDNGLRVRESLQIQHGRDARRRFLELTLPADVEAAIATLLRAENRVERVSRVADRRASMPTQQTQPALQREIPVLETPPQQRDTTVVKTPTPAPAKTETPPTTPTAPTAPTAPTNPDTARPTAPEPRRQTVAPEIAAVLRRVTALVSRWLGKPLKRVAELDELDAYIADQEELQKVAIEQHDELFDRSQGLKGELQEARAAAEVFEVALAVSEENARAAARQTQLLRQELLDLKQFDRAWVHDTDDPKVWGSPQNMTDLLARLDPEAEDGPHPILQHLRFSGDLDAALAVGRHDGLGRHASNLWYFLLVLHDYAGFKKAGTFSGNVHQYLMDDTSPQGRKCSTERHSNTESELVLENPKLRAERELPAPIDSEKDRRLLMAAHFKPTKNDGYAARMHYADDLDDNGLIFVGYIGKHLSLPRKY